MLEQATKDMEFPQRHACCDDALWQTMRALDCLASLCSQCNDLHLISGEDMWALLDCVAQAGRKGLAP